MQNQFRNSNAPSKSTAQHTPNAAARQAELNRLAQEYSMESFMAPEPKPRAEALENPFAAFPSSPSPEDSNKPPVVVVIKRRRLCLATA